MSIEFTDFAADINKIALKWLTYIFVYVTVLCLHLTHVCTRDM